MGCQFDCARIVPCPVEGDRGGELDAQKKIHGAAASAAERCDYCEKDSLLPVCRSWREHRPVYGPSLNIEVVRVLSRQGGWINSTFKFVGDSLSVASSTPAIAWAAVNATFVPIPLNS